MLNTNQLGALQSANTGIQQLDQTIQATCYPTVAACAPPASSSSRATASHWLRVPQTHQIEAADALGTFSTKLDDAAAKLAPRVGTNAACPGRPRRG